MKGTGIKPFSHHNTDIPTGEIVIDSGELIFTDPFREDIPSGVYEFKNFLTGAYVERAEFEGLYYVKFQYCHFRDPLTDHIETITILFDDEDIAFKTVVSINVNVGLLE